jgi:hypothetical protein
VQDYERAQLLERIDREGGTVGVSIPDQLEVDGEVIDLAAFVFDAKSTDGPPESEVRAVIQGLRGERRRRRARIESGDISREAGEELVASILGIDRALNALEGESDLDLEAESQRRRQADRKRWLSFLDSVTGDESRSSGGHGRSK